MSAFCIELAGRTFKIYPQGHYIEDYCADYIVDGDSGIVIQTTAEDIEFEKEKSLQENGYSEMMKQLFSDDYLETLAVYRKIASAMLDYDTLLFHGSAISVDGEGYLFAAKSGTGKSTHTRLWRELFGKRAVMVNDDKPLLKISDQGVMVCGTPWNGKHRLSTNISVPLKALCILGRDKSNHIEPIGKMDAFAMLLQQSYRPSDAEKMAKVLKLLDRLGSSVRLYSLGCNMEPEAAVVAYEGMKERIG